MTFFGYIAQYPFTYIILVLLINRLWVQSEYSVVQLADDVRLELYILRTRAERTVDELYGSF